MRAKQILEDDQKILAELTIDNKRMELNKYDQLFQTDVRIM